MDVLGARGLDREMVYMISLVWLPASSFFHGWYTTSERGREVSGTRWRLWGEQRGFGSQ